MSLIQTKQINYSAYKYQEAVLDTFSSICEPLWKHLNFKTFHYMKLFPDGRYLSLNNHLEWQKYKFNNINNYDAWLGHYSLISPIESTDFISLALSSKPDSKYLQAMLNFNIWNSFIILKMRSEYVESWSFGSEREQTEMQNFCIKNQYILLKFVNYFNNAAKEIIEVNETDNYKLAIYKNGINYPNKATLPKNEHLLLKDKHLSENFLKDLKDRNETLLKKMGKSWLTQREIECLSHLTKGETAKQIARNLNLSVRTIETYITRIKMKSNYTLRSDLIKFYHNNVF